MRCVQLTDVDESMLMLMLMSALCVDELMS